MPSSDDERKQRRDEILRPVRPTLIPVPAVLFGVCDVCRSGCEQGALRCRPCTTQAATRPVPLVLPMAMCVRNSQLHKILRGHKGGFTDQETRRHTKVLAAIVSLFVESHHGCLGEFDAVVTVPSPNRDASALIIDWVASLKPYRRMLLAPVHHVDHRAATSGAYRVTSDVSGQRLLVFDDTFATGAAIFSATWALEDAGSGRPTRRRRPFHEHWLGAEQRPATWTCRLSVLGSLPLVRLSRLEGPQPCNVCQKRRCKGLHS